MFRRSLFVLLSIFFWPLFCLFFCDMRIILIAPLVSSTLLNDSITTLHYNFEASNMSDLIKFEIFYNIHTRHRSTTYSTRKPMTISCYLNTIYRFLVSCWYRQMTALQCNMDVFNSLNKIRLVADQYAKNNNNKTKVQVMFRL